MVKDSSYMFLTGPGVVKQVTGETVSQEDLGGASVHASRSGVAHFAADDEREGIAMIKELLSFLPQNNLETAPERPTQDPAGRTDDALDEIIPDSPNKAGENWPAANLKPGETYHSHCVYKFSVR
jgi:acetyl-CoA carboxylase carboxyltransferase component